MGKKRKNRKKGMRAKKTKDGSSLAEIGAAGAGGAGGITEEIVNRNNDEEDDGLSTSGVGGGSGRGGIKGGNVGNKCVSNSCNNNGKRHPVGYVIRGKYPVPEDSPKSIKEIDANKLKELKKLANEIKKNEYIDKSERLENDIRKKTIIYKNDRENDAHLPDDGDYVKYDVDLTKFGKENSERIAIDKKTGDVWYSPCHYKLFIKIADGILETIKEEL